jgi:hypothetical protein
MLVLEMWKFECILNSFQVLKLILDIQHLNLRIISIIITETAILLISMPWVDRLVLHPKELIFNSGNSTLGPLYLGTELIFISQTFVKMILYHV